jgi:hypothetical protein
VFGSKKESKGKSKDHKVEERKAKIHSTSSLSVITTLRTENGNVSEHTIKPTVSTTTKAKEKVDLRDRMKVEYLKFEAKAPHGKDREIMKARKEAGLKTEKLGREIQPKVMIWQSAP